MPRALLAPALLLAAGCASDQLGPRDYRLIAGRTFVVTGASSGLGKGAALEFGRHGGNVVLAARRAEALEEVAAAIRLSGGQALVVPTDVSDPAQMARLDTAAAQRFGRVDVWINNAGVGALGPFERIPVADHARVVDVNLKGVIHGSWLAVNRFKAQGSGTLVNLGSVESYVPLPYHNTYAATKAGVLALSTALRHELRLMGFGRRIKVATVLPFGTDTPYFTHTANYTGGTPRMKLLDPPEKAVAAIVRAAIRPRAEIAVGLKSKAVVTGRRWLPGPTQRVASDLTHRWQMEEAPPAPPTPGSLHQPMTDGTGVSGGVRERVRREDKAREAGPRS